MILNADYPRFLQDLYLSCPGLADRSYAEQMAVRNQTLFGEGEFYARNFTAHGHEAAEFHINNPWLQHAWARENGLDILPFEAAPVASSESSGVIRRPLSKDILMAAKRLARPYRSVLRPLMPAPGRAGGILRRALSRVKKTDSAYFPGSRSEWEGEILREQIRRYRPDLILNQELAYLRSPFFRTARPPGTLLFGQIASAMPERDDFAGYDLMISSLPNQVEWFRKRGVPAELNRLGCDPVVLERMGPQPPRDIAVSFVGSLSADHTARIAFLEYLVPRIPLKIWGVGIESLPKSSPLHGVYMGQAWGRDMYDVIRRSRITLNKHIDLAGEWANNLRLYEATMMGTLLLTDWKRNLHEMFVPEEHVASYADAQDCVRQVHRFLADEEARSRIAAAGQRHALTTQTYYLRTGEIIRLAEARRK
jgi:hypothetical protein